MTWAALLLLAPGIYAAIGLGSLRLVGAHRERLSLGPLVGLVVSGWVPLVALALGGVPFFVSGSLLVLGVLGVVSCRDLPRAALAREGARLYSCYVGGLLFLALAATPAPGLWGTDWAMYVRAGEALLSYAADPGAFDTLPALIADRPRLFAARPHLFSAAIAPLSVGLPALLALEVLSSVAGASLLLAVGFAARRLGRAEPSGLWLVFFLSLPLYAYHLLALWPKFMAAASVLVALSEGYAYRQERSRSTWLWAWGWLGVAIAVHHASLLYLPLLVLLVWRGIGRGRLLLVGLAVVALLATAGVYELWALSTLGLEARVQSNPSVYQATSFDLVFLLGKTVQQLFASVLGTGLPFAAEQLLAARGAPFPVALGHLSDAVSGWLVFLAGTFVGNLLPLLFVARQELARGWREARGHPLFSTALLGFGIALLGASLLAPIVHLSAAQLGAMPSSVALVYFASSRLTRPKLLRALWVSLATGALPLVAYLVATRAAFERALSGDAFWLDWFLRFEGDARLLFALDETTLSQALSPAVLLALAALLAVPLGIALGAARGR
jgi:hypothetical protein